MLRYDISPYMFIYDPSMPGIGNQSELIQSVNELEVRKGNINIKPTAARSAVLDKIACGAIVGVGDSEICGGVLEIDAVYNDRRVSFHEEFFGRPEIVSRTGTGQPGKFAYTTNYLALDYTFMPSSKTLFAVNVAALPVVTAERALANTEPPSVRGFMMKLMAGRSPKRSWGLS